MSRLPPFPSDFTDPTPNDAPDGALSPDPGSRTARTLALLCLLVFFGVTVYLQQSEHGQPTSPKGAPAKIVPPSVDPDTWMAKFIVKFSHSDLGGQNSPQGADQFIPGLEKNAKEPQDKIRVAIVAADLQSPDAAINRLKQIATEHGLDPSIVTGPAVGTPSTEPSPAQDAPSTSTDESAAPASSPTPASTNKTVTDGVPNAPEPLAPVLIEDLKTLGAIYRGESATVSAEQSEGLEARHGWFGRLALTQELQETDPRRQAVVGGGGALFLFLVLLTVGFVGVLLAGTGLLIFFVVRILSGKVRWRFVPPAEGGSVYLETAAVFVASFVFFKLLHMALPINVAPGPGRALLISAQWLLVAPVFWPLVRGVSLGSMRKAIGWHSGQGVFREIGAGLLAYLAGVPILIAAAIGAFVLMILWELIKQAMGMPPSPPPENPIIDIIGGSDPWTVIAFIFLATCWAPIVEEAIFRGCIFRHARSRVGVMLAAIASAIIFGGMHGYAGPLLLPVTSLGFVFAMMREWRGSLIAPMTAHFLHNLTVTMVLVTLLYLLGN